MNMDRIMKYILLLTGVVFLLFATFSCNSPNEPVNSLTLTVEAASTEAWLNIKVNTISLPQKLEVTRNGETAFSLTLSSNDTTIYDNNLSPNKSYICQTILTSDKLQLASEKVVVTTLDTTSHNFSWQTFTLGDAGAGSSVLYDVAIVNDTLAYAVGEIYMKDSFGQPDLQPYNLAKWNGHTWQLFKIQFYTFCGQEHTGSYRANAVAILNDTTVWVASNNSQIAVWNGDKQTGIMCLPVSVSKMWAANKNDVYTVGALGQIGRYTDGSWEKIESGTSFSLYDIFSNDGKTIYACGGSFGNYNGIVVKGNSNGFSVFKEGRNVDNEQLFKPYFAGISKTLWISNFGTVYFGGNLFYRCKDNYLELVKSLPGNFLGGNVTGEYWGFISQVRGNGENDIILVGEGNTIRHYNGVTWQQLGLPYNYSSDYTWLSVAMKNNLIITVGRYGRVAIIMVLKR